MNRFSGLELRKVSINTFAQFIVRLVGSFGTLIATLLIASAMGYDAVGSFTKVVAFVTAFYLLVDFGFNSVFLRLYFKDAEKHLGNLVVVRLILGIILIPLVAILSALLPYNELLGTGFTNTEKTSIIVYAFTLIPVGINSCLQAILQHKLSYRLTLLPNFVSTTLLLGTIIYAISISSIYLIFASYILSASISVFLTYLLMKRRFGIQLKVERLLDFSKSLIKSSWPLGLVLFLTFLYSRTDILILTYYKQNADVGIYGIAYRFFDVALSVPTFLANSTYPLLLGVMSEKTLYIKTFRKYLFLYAAIGLAITPIIIALSPTIQVFNKEFGVSVLPLQILSSALPFFFLTSLLQWHFIIKGKAKLLIPIYAGALVLNLALNLIFVPQYSYLAAAIATNICEILVFIVLLCYFIKSKLA